LLCLRKGHSVCTRNPSILETTLVYFIPPNNLWHCLRLSRLTYHLAWVNGDSNPGSTIHTISIISEWLSVWVLDQKKFHCQRIQFKDNLYFWLRYAVHVTGIQPASSHPQLENLDVSLSINLFIMKWSIINLSNNILREIFQDFKIFIISHF
jgi:hypothetical protein